LPVGPKRSNAVSVATRSTPGRPPSAGPGAEHRVADAGAVGVGEHVVVAEQQHPALGVGDERAERARP
jgi:hypothetical protein